MTVYRDNVPSYRLFDEKPGDPADFWVHCETLAERTHSHNWEIALHRHEQFFQLFLLNSGRGEIVTPDGILLFTAPCILFIPPDAGHGFRFSRDVEGLVLTALADRLRPLADADPEIGRFAAALRVVALLQTPPAVLARTSIELIDAELTARRPGRRPLLEAQMTTALVALVRAYLPQSTAGAAEGRHATRIEHLMTVIDTHFRERPPIAFYAGRLGLSETHLARIAREATGLTIQALADRRTLDAARRELIFTPSPVQAISYSLGFADPAYFNRFFRRHTGLTPGAFREKERARLAV